MISGEGQNNFILTAESKVWDAVVVGSGPLGIVTATILSRAGLSVLIVENGSWESSAKASELNKGTQRGRHHDGMSNGRARIVGGTSTLWGGQLTFFTKADFDRTRSGKRVWPICYEEIEEYYVQVAELIGLDLKYLDDLALSSKLKEYWPEPQAPFAKFYTRWLREPNLSHFLHEELLRNDGLSILVSAQCRSLQISDEGTTSRGVLVTLSNGQDHVIEARTCVLANGTIEIARLLQLSQMHSPTGIFKNNNKIGKYFQDHIDVPIGNIERNGAKIIAHLFENQVISGFKYQPKLRIVNSDKLNNSQLNIACSMQFHSKFADDFALLKQVIKSFRTGRKTQVISRERLRSLFQRMWIIVPVAWRYLRHRRIMAMFDGGITIVAHCEQHLIEDSQITLDAENLDRYGDPSVALDWQINEECQVEEIRSFALKLQQYLSESLGVILNLDAWITSAVQLPDSARDSYHQCGGAVMGVDKDSGAVDMWGKVFGLENVFLAGACTFPSSSYANPTFTAMALASRTAKRIIEVLK